MSLRASDIFKTMKWGQNVSSSGYNGTYRSDFDSRWVYLNISVLFGNTTESYRKSKKEKRNTNEQNDQNQDNNSIGR